MTAEERQAAAEEIPALRHLDAHVCDLCLGHEGSECHTPGCVFWMHDVPTEDTALALRAAVEVSEPYRPEPGDRWAP
jgi:hypothetical protein